MELSTEPSDVYIVVRKFREVSLKPIEEVAKAFSGQGLRIVALGNQLLNGGNGYFILHNRFPRISESDVCEALKYATLDLNLRTPLEHRGIFYEFGEALNGATKQ